MRLPRLHISAVGFLAATLLLAGCGAGVSIEQGALPIAAPVGTQGLTPMEGIVHGGQQPLANAQIYVFAASTTGNGGNGVAASTSNASLSLLKSTTNPVSAGYPIVKDTTTTDITYNDYGVTTDTNGGFKIPDVACTTGTQIYLFSLGGKPGATANPAAGLLAVLGTCTGTTISSSLGSNTRIVINEASTVAAAYALAGFATDAVHIGAYSATNQTLAATGLANAFANANQLESLTYGSTTARTTTPNGNGVVPADLLNSIANSLGACVNLASGACSTLESNATSTGVSSGTKPTETATAAIYIAQHPQANVATIFTLPSSTGYFFYPYRTIAPNDFTITIVFTGGGMGTNTAALPHGIAVDASGDVWVANSVSTILSAFSPLGVAVVDTGHVVDSNPLSVAIDTSGNAWTANYGGNDLSEVTPAGAVTTYSSGFTLTKPTDLEFNYSGNLFVTGAAAVKLLPPAANSLTATNGKNVTRPYSVAVQAGSNGDVYVADNGAAQVAYDTSADVGGAATNTALAYEAYSIAVDGSNRAWVGETSKYLALYTAPGGTVTETSISTSSQAGVAQVNSVAIDGSGNVFATDNTNGDIAEMNSSDTALLSGTYGFLAGANTASQSAGGTVATLPNSLAIDGSGNVWYTTSSNARLYEIIGLATPVATPIVYGVINSKLGQRP